MYSISPGHAIRPQNTTRNNTNLSQPATGLHSIVHCRTRRSIIVFFPAAEMDAEVDPNTSTHNSHPHETPPTNHRRLRVKTPANIRMPNPFGGRRLRETTMILVIMIIDNAPSLRAIDNRPVQVIAPDSNRPYRRKIWRERFAAVLRWLRSGVLPFGIVDILWA